MTYSNPYVLFLYWTVLTFFSISFFLHSSVKKNTNIYVCNGGPPISVPFLSLFLLPLNIHIWFTNVQAFLLAEETCHCPSPPPPPPSILCLGQTVGEGIPFTFAEGGRIHSTLLHLSPQSPIFFFKTLQKGKLAINWKMQKKNKKLR
jgi:hypothetical protein